SSQSDRWIATWRPPEDAHPQVALFAAWDDADAQLAVLPLWGTATLAVQADAPDAEITLEVPGRKFTGHAGRDGHAVISFVAPPGPRTGLVHAVDRLGNMSNKEVPLGIPEVPRLLMAASPAEAPADAHTPVVVRAFAATADGKPDGSVALVNVPSHAVAP